MRYHLSPRLYSLTTAFGALWMVGAACDAGMPGDPTAAPSWEEFHDAAVRVADGQTVYVVDGDVAVTLEQLRQAYEAFVASPDVAPRSIVNTVNGEIDRWTGGKQHGLRYCVSNSFGSSKTRVVREMAAAARSWELAANVNFKYVSAEDAACTASNTKVLFAVRPWDQGGARAFFPSSPPAERTLWIDLVDFDTNPDWDTVAPQLTTTGVLRHELGHVMGLRHEHTRPKGSLCPENNNWVALGDYDKQSVMHYPWCAGVSTADWTLTIADEMGALTLYGPPVVVLHQSQVGADFNGDGRSDIGLTGPSGWKTLPLAMANGNGFTVTNKSLASFAGYAGQAGVMTATGDFNGDHRTDIALTGPASWTTLPVAMSAGNGTFTVTNATLPSWPDWAERDDAHLLPGDYNGDHRTDLALLGPSGWASLPVAMSNGNGTFKVSNSPVVSFAGWASHDNVRLVPADFNGDGRTDIALTGAAGWATLPVAFSKGDGSFTITNKSISSFAGWAATAGALVLPGDYDGDGKTDLALTGPSTWATMPVAFSNGDGTFKVTNVGISQFADWSETGSRPIVGDFDADGRSDIALTGPASWATVPVAYSSGTGAFTVANHPASSFAGYARQEGVTTLR